MTNNYLCKIGLAFALLLFFCSKALAQSVADVPVEGKVFYIEDGMKRTIKKSARKAADESSPWSSTCVVKNCFDTDKIGKEAWLMTADGETELSISLEYSGDDERYLIKSQDIFFFLYDGNDLFHDDSKILLTDENITGSYTTVTKERKATVHVTAPYMFPVTDIPYYTFYIVIQVNFKNGGSAAIARNLGVSRNGLFLLHGLNGDRKCFDAFRRYLVGNKKTYIVQQIFLQDYSSSNTSSFNDNTHKNHVVKNGLKELSNHLFNVGIASTKYDMIGHSMGGILERLYIQEVDDKHTNKLITLNTPHFGSGYGDAYLAYKAAQLIPKVRDNKTVQKVNAALDKFFATDPSKDAIIDLGKNSAAIANLAATRSKLYDIPVCAVGTEVENYEGTKNAAKEYYYIGYDYVWSRILDREVKHKRYYLDEDATDGSDYVVSVESQKGGCEKSYIYKGHFFQAMHCNSTEWEVIHEKLNDLLTTTYTYPFSDTGFGAPPSRARSKAGSDDNKYVTEFAEPKPTSFIKIEAKESNDPDYTHELTLTHSNDMMTTMAFCVLTKDEMISDFDKDVMYFDMSGFEGERTVYAVGRTDYNALVIDSVKVRLGGSSGIKYLKNNTEFRYTVNGNNLQIENAAGPYIIAIYNAAGQVLTEMNSNPSHTYALPRNNGLLIVSVRSNNGKQFFKVMTNPNK
jgi:hypothetical protein